jgi:chemotaxis protein methyltransferase WspC
MNLAPFEALLKETIGLDIASIGASAVERVVMARARACDRGDSGVYLERLRTSPDELTQLVDAVVVPETWFFRDRGAFSTLARLLRSEWNRGKDRLRLLSIPCASGEEPYSIAITLLEAGLPRDRFEIDAIDVSPRLIGLAAAAIYGKNSFRGADSAFRSRYFTRETDGYRLAEAVRSCVRFRAGNLLDPGLIVDAEAYDVVFCRNLLIYFDAATQDRALGALTHLVRADGLLFLGPSETNLILGRGFAPIKAPMAFAFRKETAAAVRSGLAATSTPGQRMSHPFSVRSPSTARAARPEETPTPSPFPRDRSPASAPAPIEAGLREIQRVADAGHLPEAARLCEAHLRDAGPSPDGLVLLALIRDAAGNAPEAIELYRKALYLEPHHEAALAHLALRLEREGDGAGADRLRERMRRIGGSKAK